MTQKQDKEEKIYFNGKEMTLEEYKEILNKYSNCNMCMLKEQCKGEK